MTTTPPIPPRHRYGGLTPPWRWRHLGPALRGIDKDLTALETAITNGGGGGSGGGEPAVGDLTAVYEAAKAG